MSTTLVPGPLKEIGRDTVKYGVVKKERKINFYGSFTSQSKIILYLHFLN